MQKVDVVTVGDSIVDIYLSIHDTAKYCRRDHEHNEICFESGAKILIDNADIHLGGNASNVAVGLKRLGFNVGLAAEIGDDEFSGKIINTLTEEGVIMDLVKKTKGAASTFSLILGFMNDRTLFARHVIRGHNISFEGVNAKWVYLTSLGKEWKTLYKNVYEFIKNSGIKLMFNPGTTQLSEGRENLFDLLSVTKVLMVNREEAEEIAYGQVQTSESEKTDPQFLTQELKKLGPKIVCITDGKKGSYVLSETGEFLSLGIFDGEIVGKTGAGDAYSAGFLGALISGLSIKEAMNWGTAESASVVEHIGAEVGLLTKEALIKRMEESLKKI